MYKKIAIYFMVFSLLSGCASINSTQKSSEVFNTKSYITNKAFKSVIPIDIWNNKVFLNAKANGKQYRFILDTGSPTLLTKKVARDLGLKIKGENTGKDANGNLVKTKNGDKKRCPKNGVQKTVSCKKRCQALHSKNGVRPYI